MDSLRIPELRLIPLSSIEMAIWEWPGEGPPILFAHATGYHGRLWDHIVRLLPGRHAIAMEARGHGRSSKPAPPYDWLDFGRDLAELGERLGLEGAIGVGHSMGGYAVARAARLRPQTFQRLLLIDPTVLPKSSYRQKPLDGSFTLRRRRTFASVTEMVERFHKRPPFVSWKPDILQSYCEFGLLPDGDALRLACPPEVEASIYQNSNAPGSDIHADVAQLVQPTVVLRAGKQRMTGELNLSASPTDPELTASIPNGREVVLEDSSHYIPMEFPERVAEELRSYF